jgi:hypothetical protein
MPKRIVDGNALWTSDKLLLVNPKYKAEYAYLIPLAFANGTFICDARLVWHVVYSYNRPEITPEIVGEILNEFERAKMLFRWRGEDGKVWGYWVGINHPGRLPRLSRQDHEKRGLEVPIDLLQEFLSDTSGAPLVYRGDTDPALGLGKGKGKGEGAANAESPSVTEAKTPDSLFILRTSKDRPSDTQVNEATDGGAGGYAPASEEKLNDPPVQKGRVAQPEPNRRKRSSPVQQQGTPASLPTQKEPFDALDFAFEQKEPFDGYEPTILRRIVFFHWKVAKPFWSLPSRRIDSPARLSQILPKMAEQMPPDFKVPGSATLVISKVDPDCTLCNGQGYTPGPNSAYSGEISYLQANPCPCRTQDMKPWRRWTKEREAA